LYSSFLFVYTEALLQARMMRSLSQLSLEKGEQQIGAASLQRALSVRKSKSDRKKKTKVCYDISVFFHAIVRVLLSSINISWLIVQMATAVLGQKC